MSVIEQSNPWRFRVSHLLSLVIVCLALVSVSAIANPNVSIHEAIRIAQLNDPWLVSNVHQQQAVEAESIAIGQLPDPNVSLEWANVPVDTFDLGQEPMTQLKLGVKQVFPRGKSRQLKQLQMRQTSSQYPLMRDDRQAKVALSVSRLWLEVYRYRQAIRTIQQDKPLVEDLVEVVLNRYASALGGTQKQDVVRAQLELTRLEDRLIRMHSDHQAALAQLSEWFVGTDAFNVQGLALDQPPQMALPIALRDPSVAANDRWVMEQLVQHPKIRVMDQQVSISETDMAIQRQAYKPEWGIHAAYGYRDEDPQGRDRANFVSVGVQFDLPLFTRHRQDQRLSASASRTEATKTERTLALRALKAQFEVAYAQYQRLDQRQSLYARRLLNEIYDQADAALSAYTHDTGDFSDVIRARIEAIDARIEQLNIEVDRLIAIAQLHYFLAPAEAEAPVNELGDRGGWDHE